MSSSLSFSDGLSTKLPHPKARKRAARRCTARGRRARTSTRCTAWACSTTSTSCRSRPRTARWRTPRRGPCRGRRPPCSRRRWAAACLASWPGACAWQAGRAPARDSAGRNRSTARARKARRNAVCAGANRRAARTPGPRSAWACEPVRTVGSRRKTRKCVLGLVCPAGQVETEFFVTPDKQKLSARWARRWTWCSTCASARRAA